MKRSKQRGGFAVGLIVGLLVGLALALGVALYVTKVPIPFVNKVPPRPTEADERERNSKWDPNAPLHGSSPARPGATPAPEPAREAPPAAATAEADRAPAADPAAPPPGVAQTAPQRDPAQPPPISAEDRRQATAIFSDRQAPAVEAPALSTRPREDPFIYFVQAGAFGRHEDAEQQRARLAMLGVESRISEREQAGRTVFRVRVGPFDKRERADETKARLAGASVEGVLVRVQK